MKPDIMILAKQPRSRPDLSDCLATILQAEGHQVRTTSADGSALSQIHSDPPSLILLPAQMQDFSGLDLCRRLRHQENTHRIPLLVVTGDRAEQIEAFRAGAADVIPVPLEPVEVLARVRTHLDLALLRADEEREVLQPRQTALVENANDDGWIRLAMQAGRLFAFEWDIRTYAIHRSCGAGTVLGANSVMSKTTEIHSFQEIHRDDKQRLQQILAILSPAYDMYDTHLRVRQADGRWVNLRVSGRGLFDHAGRLTRVIGVAADITEQVAACNELEQNQTDLLAMIQKLPLAVALANEYGRIEYINERFTKSFGYDLQDIADPDAWWERAYPSEAYRIEVIQAWRESVDAAARQGNSIAPREYQITAKDGTTHSVEIFGAVVAKRRLILFDDITERKRAEALLRESEQWFRFVANTAPVMLWVSGTDKLCTFFNKNWLMFTGRTLEQETANGWAAGVHPADLQRCLETYTAAFDRRENFQMEYRLRRADGEYRWILDTGTPRFGTDGAFAGYIGSAIDITDLKHKQEEMLSAQRLESLGLLAGGVAHDFNNLLGCILANADVIMSEIDIDSPARGGVEQIEAVAVRASQIVRQIMNYIGADQEDLEPVNLSILVEEMLQLLRVCIPKRARLNIELPPSVIVPRANAAQLRQVVMNLIINAAEALGDCDGVISVLAKRGCWYDDGRDPGGTKGSGEDFVCLQVADTGSGMSADVVHHIFDPFFSTKLTGRGFGLAAVQTIVRSHGGIVQVSSTPGKGTTFEVLLPTDHHPAAYIPRRSTVRTGFAAQRSVLIVEDDQRLRTSVAKILSRKGFSVIDAADGDCAVRLIRDPSQDIALVLLDLTLPGTPSQEVFAELQRSRPGVKVILTTPYGRESVAGQLNALDYENIIRKPYHLNELVTIVRQALPLETVGPAGENHHGGRIH